MSFLNLVKNENKISVVNKSETNAEILIYGPIGDDPWDSSAISAKMFAEELAKLPKTIKNIDLRVNSPGGSVFDGSAIYERLKQHPAKITAYVDGVAASIASLIIMAADEIIISDNGYVMIHLPIVGIYGNRIEMERMISILDKIENQLITAYSRKTGMSRIDIQVMLEKETWLTSNEAIDYKFADRNFENSEGLQIAASMIKDCTWLKNKPTIQNSADIAKAKIKEFNNSERKYLQGKKII